MRLAGGPKIEPKGGEESGNLEYSAIFEVLPEFEVKGIDNLKVERPVVEISETDIDSMLEKLRQQRVTWNQVDRPAQTGDRITLDFEGKIGDQDFPGGKGENSSVVLGDQTLFKGFEEKLIGLQPGAEAEFDVEFPEDYYNKDLAGRSARFRVNIKSLAEPVLPEIDEEFATSFNVKEDGVEGLRKAVKENMQRELQDRINAVVKRQLMQQLLDANDILLPRAMIEDEVQRLARQANIPLNKDDDEAVAKAKADILEPEARRRVALGLLISKLVAANEIKLDNERVQDRLEDIASTYEDSAAVIQWYSQHDRLMEGVRALALEDQVVEWLLQRAGVTDKPSSFDEVMRSGRVEETSL